jgi:hypothetical protein
MSAITPEASTRFKELSAQVGYKISNPPENAQHLDFVMQEVKKVFGE